MSNVQQESPIRKKYGKSWQCTTGKWPHQEKIFMRTGEQGHKITALHRKYIVCEETHYEQSHCGGTRMRLFSRNWKESRIGEVKGR